MDSTNVTRSKSHHAGVPESYRNIEISPDEIKSTHARLCLNELPEYAVELRGFQRSLGKNGRPLNDAASSANWGFVVPKDRIADFKEYLENLGVPHEFANAESSFGKSVRESDWTAPNPPARDLTFVRSLLGGADSTYLGLSFRKGESMIYVLENPNLKSSDIHITFAEKTGNVFIGERYINR